MDEKRLEESLIHDEVYSYCDDESTENRFPESVISQIEYIYMTNANTASIAGILLTI